MAKKRMPFYEIIVILRDFLAHNFTKYQYFSIRPSLFVSFYQTTYSLLVSAQYLLKCGFFGPKMHKSAISQRSVSSFLSNKVSHPTFFNISALNFEYSFSTKFGR